MKTPSKNYFRNNFSQEELVQTSFFTTKAINDKLKEIAKTNGVSKADLIERLLLEFFEKTTGEKFNFEELPEPPKPIENQREGVTLKDLVISCENKVQNLEKILEKKIENLTVGFDKFYSLFSNIESTMNRNQSEILKHL